MNNRDYPIDTLLADADVSQQHQASNSFVRTLMDTMPEGMVVTDVSGDILAFNHAASVLFGYTEKELLGRNIAILMPPAVAEAYKEAIRTYLESGQSEIIGRERVGIARDKDGRKIPIKLAVNEAKVGRQRMFIGYIEDVTETVRQDRKLRMLGSELAHASRVASIGGLAGAISHELNQPLAAIRNYVETVAEMARGEGPLDRRIVSEAMSACGDETFRAGEIIRRIREYVARGDAETTRESLSELVQAALVLALVDGDAAGVDVSLHLEPSADAVIVDRIEIQQVIFNLARNALQAMEGAKRKLIVVSSLGGEEMVEVVVEDSGPGLEPEREAQLVLPFVSGRHGGMGLGLQICQTIVEAHGGRIWSTRSEFGGAALHFTVPRMPEEVSVSS